MVEKGSRRQVTGQGPGELLAGLLNQEVKRDRRATEAQHELRKMFADLPRLLVRLQGMLPGEAAPPDVRQRIDEINRFLSHCAEYPFVEIVSVVEAGRPRQPFLVQEFAPVNPAGARRMACVAISALVRYQLLDRVRQCLRCSTWFFAKKSDAKYCSRKCQTAPTEEYRRSKREYAKRHYRELKRREQQAKTIVKRRQQ